MKIEVIRRSLLEANDRTAAENRRLFDEHGVRAVNILGGAGCGKTSLLESVIPELRSRLRLAVLEGDVATTRDAERIAALGVPVVQLLTDGGCHLTANLVHHGLGRLPLDRIDLLLIENVGNPICPANFDLGEHRRVVVLSVTEGDDKPAKYPLLFKVADLVVISKVDLLPMTDFDLGQATANIRALDRGERVMLTSARKPLRTQALADWLEALCAEGRGKLCAGSTNAAVTAV